MIKLNLFLWPATGHYFPRANPMIRYGSACASIHPLVSPKVGPYPPLTRFWDFQRPEASFEYRESKIYTNQENASKIKENADWLDIIHVFGKWVDWELSLFLVGLLLKIGLSCQYFDGSSFIQDFIIS
jgi:hypothetical protein